MLEWKTPELEDGKWIRPIVAQSGNMGSDLAFANMFLLREKYDIKRLPYKEVQWKGNQKGIYISGGNGKCG